MADSRTVGICYLKSRNYDIGDKKFGKNCLEAFLGDFIREVQWHVLRLAPPWFSEPNQLIHSFFDCFLVRYMTLIVNI